MTAHHHPHDLLRLADGAAIAAEAIGAAGSGNGALTSEGAAVSGEGAESTQDAEVDFRIEPTSIEAGQCADGIVARGKQSPTGPAGSRQGVNDYTLWFAGDKDMGGTYFGYDGPCPPWNDAILHHYHFILYATDLARCPVEGNFPGAQVRDAIAKHVLAEARLTGTYSLNPAVK